MDNKSLTMEILHFENKEQLEIQLAKKIAYDLEISIHKKGFATLLLSGGSTPVNLYKKMSLLDIAWENVSIGLIDERFVPTDHKSSNELMIKESLLKHFAQNANFIGLVKNPENLNDNLAKVNEDYKFFSEKGIDVSILGMGEDGHTASLFPNDESSEQDLKFSEQKNIISTIAPNEPKIRISCSKKLIQSSNNLYLMIFGTKKLSVLDEAENKKLPISYFCQLENLKTYYSE